MQDDGNLVVYDAPKTLWSSGTSKGALYMFISNEGYLVVDDENYNILWNTPYMTDNGPYQLIAQDDGNLVIYNKNGKATWASGTGGHPAGKTSLAMQGGSLILNYQQALWASNTCGHPGAQLVTNNGDWLIFDPSQQQTIWSLSSQENLATAASYQFYPYGDPIAHGTLVVYDGLHDFPMWYASEISPSLTPYSMEFHEDGNVVIYDNTHAQVWISGSTQSGAGIPSLAIQNGTLVINYSRALWNTGTGGHSGTALYEIDGNLAVWGTN